MGALKIIRPLIDEDKIQDAKHFQIGDGFSFSKHKLLVTSTSEGHRIIPFETIRSIRSASNYSILSLLDGKSIILSQTLKRVENQLDNTFMRVHNSHIINLVHLRLYDYGNNEIQLDDGSHIPVARSKKMQLKSILKLQLIFNIEPRIMSCFCHLKYYFFLNFVSIEFQFLISFITKIHLHQMNILRIFRS